MWPYDYFNEYSALLNEFDLDNNSNKKRSIFVAKWYQETIRTEVIERAIKTVDRNMIISTRKKREKIEDDIVRLGLRLSMPSRTKKGDINLDILKKIIEARLVICDITPENLEKIINQNRNNRNFYVRGVIKKEKQQAIFNHNTMIELGLALAWKTPEQVIIVYDKRYSLKEYKLPFDIQDYFCIGVNFKNRQAGANQLTGTILHRLRELKNRRDIILKNLVSKLDPLSLQVLWLFKGKPFPDNVIDPQTIRYLFELGILSSKKFPAGTSGVPFICYFTELGRFIMDKGLGIKPIPKIFADTYLVRYMKGYRKSHSALYRQEHRLFHREHGRSWNKCNRALVSVFHDKGYNSSKDIVQLHKSYYAGQIKGHAAFEHEIIEPWMKRLRLR